MFFLLVYEETRPAPSQPPPTGRGPTLSSVTCPISPEGWTRRVRLVRKEGRDVSTLYGREGRGGGGAWDEAEEAVVAVVRELDQRAPHLGAACPLSTG